MKHITPPPQLYISYKDVWKNGYRVFNHCLMWRAHPREEPKLSTKELRKLMKEKKAWMARNLYDFDCACTTNFWEIICDRQQQISDLPSKSRNLVRRCLRDCEVRKVTNLELLEADGYTVYRSSFTRYNNVVTGPKDRASFEAILRQSSHLDIYAVFRKEDNRCIAYAYNVIDGDVVKYSSMKAIPEFLNKHYPFYGMIFVMTNDYLSAGYRYVTDGFRTITEHSNIQPFLEHKLNFRKAYCRVNIIYAKWLEVGIRILYPFRKFVRHKKVKVLLNLESINREKFKR